jgi:glycerol uptake facilitator-like aquaporin
MNEEENSFLREVVAGVVLVLAVAILVLHSQNNTVEMVLVGLAAFVVGTSFSWQNKIK